MPRAPTRPRRAHSPLLLGAFVGLFLTTPGAVPGQEVDPLPRSAFSATLESTVAELEVTVTNQEGTPVGGLSVDDFRLEIDGQPVPLRSAQPGALVRASPGEAADPAPLTLFVDWSSLGPAARRQMTEHLEQLEPLPDEVLVASWDGTALTLRRLHGDHAELAVVLDGLAAQAPPNPRSGGRDLGRLIERIETAQKPDEILPSPEGAPSQDAEVLHEIRSWAEQRSIASRNLLAAAARVIQGLAGVPGRKAMVMVTADLPERPADDLFRAWAENASTRPGEARPSGAQLTELDFAPHFDRLAELANRSRVTLYPAYLHNQGSVIAASRVAGSNLQQSLERIQAASASEGARHLAEGTGGIASWAPGALDTLLRGALGGTAGDYTLVFTPPEAAIGPRRLHVHTRDPALDVRHRPTLPARSGDELMAGRLQAALLLDMGRNDLEARLGLAGEEAADEGRKAVTLEVSVPLDRLLLEPGPEAHQGRVRLVAGASRDQQVVEVTGLLAPIRIPNPSLLTALGQRATLRAQLRLAPGRYRVGVVLLDELSGAQGSVAMDLDVAE